MQRYYKPSQVAELLGVHVKTVLRWLRAGHMDATKIPPNRWMISRETLLQHMRRNNTI